MPLRPARHQPWLVALCAAAAALLAAGVALVLSAAGMGSGTPDEYFGLPDDTGRDEVMAYCGACHSMKLVVQQGLNPCRLGGGLVRILHASAILSKSQLYQTI